MTDDTHLQLAAEHEWDDEACPVCGAAFDTDAWTLRSHAGDAWGGSATYICPTRECPGTTSVLY